MVCVRRVPKLRFEGEPALGMVGGGGHRRATGTSVACSHLACHCYLALLRCAITPPDTTMLLPPSALSLPSSSPSRQRLHRAQPPDWSEHLDEQQNQFFFNSATESSSYEHPYDPIYQKIYSQLSESR